MKRVILASSSPRRRELLDRADIKYTLCIKETPEDIPEGLTPGESVEYLAEQKAAAVARMNDEDIVIGADTIVVLDGRILGKPADKDDAIRMLLSLSGRKHEVITGVCLISGEEKRIFHVTSKVRFNELTYNDALRYVKTGEPMDKAGAYGIQGKGCVLVDSIEGDFYNIVGLPISRVAKEIREMQGA